MNLTIQFQYTFEEYTEGVRAISAHAIKSAKGGRSILGWILFVGLAVMLFFMLQNGRKDAPAPPPSTPGDKRRYYPLLILGFLIFIGLLAFFGRKKQERKAFEQRAELHRLRTVHFSEDGVTHDDRVSQSRTSWQGFIKFGETTNVFLLYHSDVAAIIIPKRAFLTPAAADEFRILAQSQISPARSAFPVLPPKTN